MLKQLSVVLKDINDVNLQIDAEDPK